MTDLDQQLDPQTLSLARMIAASPNAQRGLRSSIERQQQRREAARTPRKLTHSTDCPHCGAAGVPYLTLGDTVYHHRPERCCQPALRDACEKALHYASNPNNDGVERVEHADRYAELKKLITAPALLRELATHEAILDDVASRVSGLTRAQGGVEDYRTTPTNLRLVQP